MPKINMIMITLSGLAVLMLAPRGATLGYTISPATVSAWNYALISATLVFVSTGLWALAGLRRMRKAIEVRREAHTGN